MLNIESTVLSGLITKSTYLSALIIVCVIFFDVSHTPRCIKINAFRIEKEFIEIEAHVQTEK